MHFPLMTHLLGRYLIADLENGVIFLSKMANVPYNLSEKIVATLWRIFSTIL